MKKSPYEKLGENGLHLVESENFIVYRWAEYLSSFYFCTEFLFLFYSFNPFYSFYFIYSMLPISQIIRGQKAGKNIVIDFEVEYLDSGFLDSPRMPEVVTSCITETELRKSAPKSVAYFLANNEYVSFYLF